MRRAGRKYLPRDEWVALEEAVAAGRSQALLVARDEALVMLMLGTGLRVSECRDLNVSDIDFAKRRVTVRCGKGGKSAVLRATREALDLVEAYLDFRPQDLEPESPLFYSRKGNRLSVRAIQEMLAAAGARSDLGHLHPHMLRHSFGTAVQKAQGDIRVTQTALRHRRVTTTQLYTHVEDSQVDAAVDGLDAER
jgi:integrase/recombinase XerC